VPQLKSRFENFSRQLEQAFSAPLEGGQGPEIDNGNPENSGQGKLPHEDDTAGLEENRGGTKGPETTMPNLTEELSNIEQDILEAVPQLKEQIHGFVEQLQDALKLPPPQPTEKTEQSSEPIEI
jgi:hypothetical protein